MKLYLAFISAAVLGITACSQEPAAPAPATEAPAQASAATSAAESAAVSEAAPAVAADAACSATVDSDDAMKYNVSEINISKACKEFTVTLKHIGKMPKASMGHNIVIAKSEDIDGIARDGASAGADGDYLKAGDERVIAATKLIGGGEETSLTVDTGKFSAGNQYEFFCSFPGHVGLMRGKVNLVD